ncbi:MAG: histidine kinase [Pseudomonadota bacterium]
MPSINHYPYALPNFRNLGVLLRVLVIGNAMGLAAALPQADTLSGVAHAMVEQATLLQPVLIASLVVLGALNGALQRLPYAAGVAAVMTIEAAIAVATAEANRSWLVMELGPWWRYLILALLASAALLAYFNLRSRALSPALEEARLQALQARIRPHFLFNSLNAVLSLIRAQPKRAEAALEDLADLFRMAMADNRRLTVLKDEVALCRQYLELEQLRLGERLQVEWHLDKMPGDALIPPLMLQPLVENAVYHGIEPSVQPGVIRIEIYRDGKQLHALLDNPYHAHGARHAGNRLALDNIRERLSLLFDAEGTLETALHDNTYRAHITIPYLTAEAA